MRSTWREKVNEQISKLEFGENNKNANKKPESYLFFIASMASLAIFTWNFNLDFLKGLYITLGWVIIYLIFKKTLSAGDTFNTCLEGFKSMLDPLAILSAAFLLNNINKTLGLTTYAVNAAAPLLTAAILPAAIVVIMGLVAFGTGSNWGVFVIILPIVTGLASRVNADMSLVIGATLSASVFSSHACFYSDATVLTSQATGCTPFQHAWTQIPYALIAWSASVAGFLVLGYKLY